MCYFEMMPTTASLILSFLGLVFGEYIQVQTLNTIHRTSRMEKCTTNSSKNSITQDLPYEDFVNLQYNHLPYPMITGPGMKAEEKFYNRTRRDGWIYKTSIDNDLEILNNFIFKGNRDVRLAPYDFEVIMWLQIYLY